MLNSFSIFKFGMFVLALSGVFLFSSVSKTKAQTALTADVIEQIQAAIASADEDIIKATIASLIADDPSSTEAIVKAAINANPNYSNTVVKVVEGSFSQDAAQEIIENVASDYESVGNNTLADQVRNISGSGGSDGSDNSGENNNGDTNDSGDSGDSSNDDGSQADSGSQGQTSQSSGEGSSPLIVENPSTVSDN